MKELQAKLAGHLAAFIEKEWGVRELEIVFSIPPERKFGDLASPLAFSLAKLVGDKPFIIARRLAESLPDVLAEISAAQVAGGGFLNLYLDRGTVFAQLSGDEENKSADRGLVCVEHTSINPNKAAHIGHLRNVCLGDTLVRTLRTLGYQVEVQNYIDDTGIQVADVVWGLLRLRQMRLPEIQAIKNLSAYLWELYSEAGRILGEDQQAAAERREVHRRIEQGLDPEYPASEYVSRTVLAEHLELMAGLDIQYDLMVRESDIMASGLFSETARTLRRENILLPAREETQQGCQIIHYRPEKIDKIIIRSNDTVTYIGKDLAYHLWKFAFTETGLRFKHFLSYPGGKEVLISTMDNSCPVLARSGIDLVFNVIDCRQAYLQNLIRQVLEDLGQPRAAANFCHFAYEMVTLSPACAREMGFIIPEDQQGKSSINVSGRKGIAVKADDLLAKLREKAGQEIQLRNPDMSAELLELTAGQIAVGALRYFMVKYSLKTMIVFDFKEALAFEGDSGPYLQYTLVRLNSILNRCPDQPDGIAVPEAGLLDRLEAHELEATWEILLQAYSCECQLELALESREPSMIASFTYSLCQKFNNYYHHFPVLAEPDLDRKRTRLHLLLTVKKTLNRLFQVLGIPVPARM